MSISKVRVAVLRGGPSHEYEVSLKTGGHVLSLLREMPEKYNPVDVFISRDGSWHVNGVVHPPHLALSHVDVVFNGLHGDYGEDGQLQEFLESLNIPYTGSNSVASQLAMNKDMAKNIYNQHGLLSPNHVLIENEVSHSHLIFIFRNFLHPVMVKPADKGSSIGARIAHSFKELEEAVTEALKISKKVLVEEFIRGREATCGVVENARGERFYALVPVEIKRPQGKHIFEYEDKYSDLEHMYSGAFNDSERRVLEKMAKAAHEALGLKHYSRSDFIISPKGKIYILETNSLPGLTEKCPMSQSLHAVGWHPKDFVDHVLHLALTKA